MKEITLNEAMEAVRMVLEASVDEDGISGTDQETCERINWEWLESLIERQDRVVSIWRTPHG